MRLNLKIQHKGLILVTVPVIVGTIYIAMLAQLLKQADAEMQRQVQSKLMVAAGSDLSHHLLQAGMALIMYRAMHSEKPMQQYDEVVTEVPDLYRRMEELSKGRYQAEDHVKKLEKTGNDLLYLMSNFRRPKDPTEFLLQDDINYRHKLVSGFNTFLSELTDLRKEEIEFQNKHTDEESRERVKQFLWFFIAGNFALAWGLSLYFSRSITRRLAVLTENNRRLARRAPLNKPVSGADEIALLDKGFHQMAAALLKAEQRKQEFVQMISHDLRTPLSSIQGTLALALRGTYGALNEKGKSRLSDAESDSERLINMINELLDIEKIEAGKLELDSSDISMAEVVQRSIESVRSFADSHGVALSFDGADATVYGDQDRLIRVVINLLSNAVKYSPRDGKVTVTVERHPTIATIKVIDQGRGIPKDAIDKIFDRFSQVERADAKKGTGLGLAICRAVVEAHNGRIGVVSEEGAGSTFWFSLKLKHAERTIPPNSGANEQADSDLARTAAAQKNVS